MKVFDAQSLHQGLDFTINEIGDFQSKITELQKAVRGVISLDDALRGKGGEAIRSFYHECHQPFLVFMYEFLYYYNQTLVQLKQATQSFEPQSHGFVRQEYLQNDVEQGLDKVKDVTDTLTNAANSTIRSVQDIVYLPELNQSELVENVQRGKKQTTQVLEQLHALDNWQAGALDHVLEELTVMKNYISEIESKFQSGDISIADYNGGAIKDLPAHKSMMDSINSRDRGSTEKVDNLDPTKKPDSQMNASNESVLSFDPYAPVGSAGAVYSRIMEGRDLYTMHRNVGKGLSIERYVTKGGIIKYRVKQGNLIGIKNPPKPVRNSKIYEKSYIDAQVKKGGKGDNVKVAKYVNPRAGAISAVKSRAGWLGVGITTGENIYKNREKGASVIVGDASVDVGVGAVTLVAGGVAAAAVGAVGAPVLVGVAVAVGASIAVSYVLDGIKIGDKTISGHMKSGVQTVAGWFKKKK